ncbi:MAG: hypothetical protein U9R21_01355 [Candidatus Thermoplasmatota archaeon]|nr:hypothetical protein [Candidatus Thermoplasmatota archaeon]
MQKWIFRIERGAASGLFQNHLKLSKVGLSLPAGLWQIIKILPKKDDRSDENFTSGRTDRKLGVPPAMKVAAGSEC